MASMTELIVFIVSITTATNPSGSGSSEGSHAGKISSNNKRSLVGKNVKTGGGEFVGFVEIEGVEDGCPVGKCVGVSVGDSDVVSVGESVGVLVGDSVCALVGDSVGALVGDSNGGSSFSQHCGCSSGLLN